MLLTADDLRANAARVRDRIGTAALRAGRDPAEITLVAVSKTHPASTVALALQAGLDHFGENRIQEAATKVPEVARLAEAGRFPPPTWHLVGHLQTNKVKLAVDLFDTIDSLDSLRLAEALDERLRTRPGTGSLPVLLEVYLGDDPARPGFRPDDLAEAVERISILDGLALRGLMTVAPLGWSQAATRAAFGQVREIRDRLASAYPRVDFRQLSMGMTDDFELAVEEGSTMVRIGRALFGPREAR